MPGEPTWWESFEKLLDERFDSLDERFGALDKALDLQAKEYSRRLEDLNGAHAEAIRVQSTFVSFDKWEDKMNSEEVARKIALERLDEKIADQGIRFMDRLEEYIKKYEVRQREIDQELTIAKATATEAARQAEIQSRDTQQQVETQARKTRDEQDAQTRKFNRNMAIMGVALTIIIAAANFLGQT